MACLVLGGSVRREHRARWRVLVLTAATMALETLVESVVRTMSEGERALDDVVLMGVEV